MRRYFFANAATFSPHFASNRQKHKKKMQNAECTGGQSPCALLLFIVPYPDEMAWRGEGIPRDVEPAVAGQELVGKCMGLEEVDQALELLRVLGADVGSLT